MKNKKLFAILTLVCFMFTLMPVAAFASESYDGFTITSVNNAVDAKYFGYVETNYNNLDSTTSPTHLKITTNGAYFVYAVDNATGKLATLVAGDGQKQVGETVLVDVTTTDAYEISFKKPGNYTLFAATYKNTTQAGIIANTSYAYTQDEVRDFLAQFVELTMYNNVVTVAATELTPVITITTAGAYEISADKGYTSTKVLVTLKNNADYPIANADVTLFANSYGLTVTPLTEKTNAAGQMYALVTGNIPGTFEVYAQYGDVVTTTPAEVKVNAVGAKEVSVVAEPTAPVDVKTNVGDSGIVFKITDGFGNDAVDNTNKNYKVTLVSAPANFTKNDTYSLTSYSAIPGTYKLAANSVNEMKYEGTYTFMVSLQNGASATASVEVKKFDKPVAIQFKNVPTTMAYNTTGSVLGVGGVYEVDANGVTRVLTASTWNPNLTISANGKAVQNFDFNRGNKTAGLYPIADEDYVGSVVTVMAVYDNGMQTFTATNNITIVDSAATVAFKSTNAEVGVNNVLKATIVDATGALTPVTTGANVQFIVLEKPANAVVTVTKDGGAALAANKDKFDVNFLASAAGEYKIQTIVTFGGKYVSGINTITVGGGQATFQDVIVMSIGANTMVKNSATVAMPAAPEIVDSRTMVPARAGLEAFGATVVWDEAAQTVTAEMNGVKVVMTIGEKAYTVNGKVVVGDAAPYITAASTMVPVSFFTNAFGITATPIYDANGVCDVLFTK